MGKKNRETKAVKKSKHNSRKETWRQANIRQFEQTLELAKKYPLPTIRQVPRRKSNEVYFCKHDEPCWLSVKNRNCLTAIQKMVSESKDYPDYKCALLNMASWMHPGGGVEKGCHAQEEFLCKVSNLFPALQQADEKGLYPLKDGFVVENVTFFLDENYQPLAEPFVCDVITISAPRQDLKNPKDNKDQWTQERIERLFELAYGYEGLVLSAFGCGAYGNRPEQVAKIFKWQLEEQNVACNFDEIVFAIIDDHNSHGNYATFRQVFECSDSESENEHEDEN